MLPCLFVPVGGPFVYRWLVACCDFHMTPAPETRKRPKSADLLLMILRAKHIGARDFRIGLSERIRKSELVILTLKGNPVQVMVPYSEMIAVIEALDRGENGE